MGKLLAERALQTVQGDAAETDSGSATTLERLQDSPANTRPRRTSTGTVEDSAAQNQGSGSRDPGTPTWLQNPASEANAPLDSTEDSDVRSATSNTNRLREDDPRRFEHPPNPETNLGSWNFRPEAVLPEGIKPPRNPLKRDVVGTVPFEGGGEFDTGIDRRREIRFLITRLYRVGAVDANGRFRLSDEDFEKYIASATDHIEPEHAPIFELTARAVRAGALDWQVAATRMTAYFAPDSSGGEVFDFLLDIIPIVGQVKGAAEAHTAIEDSIDAAEYGDERAYNAAITKAAIAVSGLIMPGAGAVARRLAVTALEKELHHMIPHYFGGVANGPLLALTQRQHRGGPNSLHGEMQAFFRGKEKYNRFAFGPSASSVGGIALQKRIDALDAFYNSLKNSPQAYRRRAYAAWKKIFPEIRSYIQ